MITSVEILLKQILSDIFSRKRVEISVENFYVDIEAESGSNKAWATPVLIPF